jgi:hypothetical protein
VQLGWRATALRTEKRQGDLAMLGRVQLAGISGTVTLVHFLKHAQVRDAARRGHRALADAKLLDGHPEEEIEAAFLVTRLDHLALPFTKTWMGVMFR